MFRIRTSTLILFLCLPWGCSDSKDTPEPNTQSDVSTTADISGDSKVSSTDAGPSPLESINAGEDTRIELNSEGLLDLYRKDKRVLSFPAGSLELGCVPEFEDEHSYDPRFLEPGAYQGGLFPVPEGLSWVTVDSVSQVTAKEESWEIQLALSDGRSSTLTVEATQDDHLSFQWSAPDSAPYPVFFRMNPIVDEKEGFYGMGEVFDKVEHRGMVRAMQFEISNLESGYNEAHAPIPLLIGTEGWGIFVESYRAGVFAPGVHSPDRARITFGFGKYHQEGLRFHLYTADHPLDITRHYYETTGYPGAIAPWALGPWIWRDEVENQAAVEADFDTIRELDLATTGYWIDRPYASGVNSFDFKADDYPDPEGMFDYSRDMGFEMALWHAPYLDPEDEDTVALYNEAVEKGFYAPVMGTALADWGPPIDFSHPEIMDWWQDKLRPYIDLGVKGFKLDYGEEVVVGVFGSRIPWSFNDGTDESTMHRRYALLYHQAYAELLPEDGGFLLCRAATYGDQAQGVIIWPGDIDSNMVQHGDEAVDWDGDSYLAVGGLPAAIIAGNSLGPSGFPFFGSDTGGYRNAPPDRETYIRWFQHTALSTVMQVGTNTNDLPWSLGIPKVLDEEVLNLYRDYARLHLRLFPYLWTYVQKIPQDGRPIQRPLGLAYPELEEHPSDIYLLGDNLLVAPVIEVGAVKKNLIFPEGAWIDWWTGERHEPGAATVDAPLSTLPLFLRAGGIVPLLRPSIDTLSPVAEGSTIDSFANETGPLYATIAEGADGAMTLYDGSEIKQIAKDSSTELSWKPGTVFTTDLIVEFIGIKAPSSIQDSDGNDFTKAESADEISAGSWSYESDRGGTLRIHLSPQFASVRISL